MRKALRKVEVLQVGAVFYEVLSISESPSISNTVDTIADISWNEDRRKFEV
jgi:hypothetical protein